MKKRVWIGLLLITIILAGCSTNTAPSATLSSSVDENEEIKLLSELDSGNTYTVEKIPCTELEFNDSRITVSDITITQRKIDHAYVPYLLMTVDCSELSEDEWYWLVGQDDYLEIPQTNNDMTVYGYYTSDDGIIDFERMELNAIRDSKNQKMYYAVSYSSDYNPIKNKIESGKFSVFIQIEQDETYKSDEGKTYRKSYDYLIDVSEEEGDYWPGFVNISQVHDEYLSLTRD